MKHIHLTLIAILSLYFLTGCGQKGPLYLPESKESTSEK